ncbi:MAG: aminoglycoside phosphotransferase family protein [Chloroflexota bacterium]
MTYSDTRKVHQIARRVLGISDGIISSLGSGASSAAWRVDWKDDAFIVRIAPDGNNRPITYRSEFTILRLLKKQVCAVPEAIQNSFECQVPVEGISQAWTITRAVEGTAIQKRPMSSSTATELGQLLQIAHSLPAVGYGRLSEQASGIIGQQSDRLDGVQSRWCWAKLWPFDGSPLDAHPLARLKPDLIPKLRQREPEIMDVILEGPVVLTHADLHGEHIFIEDDRLTGLIDFGAACIGTPAWDFASLAFYHGWPVTQEMLCGYASTNSERGYHLEQARHVSLTLAMYKLDKAVTEKSTNAKQRRILHFIEEILK